MEMSESHLNSAKQIPMSTDEIQELFLNQDNHYFIDVVGSRLKGEAFVTYIANMQMNCSFETSDELSKENKFEIFWHYLNFKTTIKCDTLLCTLAHMMLRTRNIELAHEEKWMSEEEMDEFCERNPQLIAKITDFLDSSLLMLMSFNVEMKKNYLEPAIARGEVEVINDMAAVGVNVLGLFMVKDFIEFFISASPESIKLKYYEDQLTKVRFDKKHIFRMVIDAKEDSFIMCLVNLIFSQNKAAKDLREEIMAN